MMHMDFSLLHPRVWQEQEIEKKEKEILGEKNPLKNEISLIMERNGFQTKSC